MSEPGEFSNLAGETGFGVQQELTEFERGAKAEREKWAFRAVVVAALVFSWFFWNWVRLRAENHPGAVVALAVLIGGGIAFILWRKHGNSWMTWKWIAPFVIIAVATIWGITDGWNARNNYLNYYCEYGAVSQAQLDECMSHVNTDYINKLDTNAAHFARGETSYCGPDSGPFCAAASKWNTVTPDNPNQP